MDPTILQTGELAERLDTLFGLSPIHELVRLPGGYKCDNFRLVCGSEVFFLKAYKHRMSHWVFQIKQAEQFFARAGLPVMQPRHDCFDRPMFLANQHWHSLFPFVTDSQPERGQVRDATIVSMGACLGRLHRVGRTFREEPFQRMHGWDPGAFHVEMIELRDRVKRQPATPLHERILETLEKKARLVKTIQLTPSAIPLPYDCLLHGDFIYQNVFIDAMGHVTHVFDLEKTNIGPRAYELARSLLINCFDTAWSKEAMRQGRLFLQAYQESFPISREEFYQGMRMYMAGVAHSTWIEARILLGAAEPQHYELYESHALRIAHVTDDPRGLCDSLYS